MSKRAHWTERINVWLADDGLWRAVHEWCPMTAVAPEPEVARYRCENMVRAYLRATRFA